MRLLVINNKSSGHGDNAIYDFLRIFCEDGDEVVIRNTKIGLPLSKMLKDAEDFDLVIASGGDGTVSAVCYELRYREVPVVPYPAGTGNLLAMNLSSPEEPRAIAEMIHKENVQHYDLAEIEFVNKEGEHRKCGFSIIAGAGYDAMIMNGASGLKQMMGQSAYYFSALFGDKPKKAKITLNIDGRTITTSGIAVMLVNFAKISPDISVTHVNDAQDGLLEVVVIKPERKLALAPALLAALLDKRGQYPSRSNALEIYAGTEISVETNPPLPIQYDGELGDAYTPLVARSLPGALKTLVDDEEIVRLETLRLFDGGKQ
ncbi:MAG: diacylglycerol/lipid kinase family protein [Coriobacteriales bacterium]|jgi:diacylglycerol kinase family enzyme